MRIQRQFYSTKFSTSSPSPGVTLVITSASLNRFICVRCYLVRKFRGLLQFWVNAFKLSFIFQWNIFWRNSSVCYEDLFGTLVHTTHHSHVRPLHTLDQSQNYYEVAFEIIFSYINVKFNHDPMCGACRETLIYLHTLIAGLT